MVIFTFTNTIMYVPCLTASGRVIGKRERKNNGPGTKNFPFLKQV